MRRLITHAVTRAVLAYAGVTLVMALSYELMPVHVLGEDLSMAVTLAVVACLLVLPALTSRRFCLLRAFRIPVAGADRPRVRASLFAAMLVLLALALLILLDEGDPLAASTAPISVMLEELVFRGLPLALLLGMKTSLKGRMGVVLVSSLTFAALHFSTLPIMYVDRFIFACLALLLAFKFESLWPAVLYHALANIAALVTADQMYRQGYAWLYIPLDITIFAVVFLFCSKTTIRQMSQIGPVKVP
jgi:membrane protease YdiL (CAAX protease family)